MKILFRTSGGKAPGKELGLGHVYRCINLAKNLKKNKLFFLIEDYGNIVNNILKKNNYKNIFVLQNKLNLKQEIKKTIETIKENKIDVIVIDKYNLKQDYIDEIRKFAKTVVITDLNQKRISADLLINGFIGFKNEKIINKFGTKCLLGPQYQIIDGEFSKRKKTKKKNTLLITFGGFDENKIIDFILEPLSEYLDKIKTKIILSPATSKSKKIKNFERMFKKELTIIPKTNSMFKEISESEYGLCSGGITTYEFASKGIFFGIICQVEHQKLTAKKWQNKKMATNLGLIDEINYKKIKKFLDDILRKKHPNKIMKIVDGKGSQRVASEILKMKI